MTDQVKIDADWLRGKAEFAPDEETEARYKEIADRMEQNQRRLNWVANELLACDYGDNNHPSHVVGWHVYGWRNAVRKHDRRIYGDTINMAVDLELAKAKQSTGQERSNG